eukprot:gene1913-3070_t
MLGIGGPPAEPTVLVGSGVTPLCAGPLCGRPEPSLDGDGYGMVAARQLQRISAAIGARPRPHVVLCGSSELPVFDLSLVDEE